MNLNLFKAITISLFIFFHSISIGNVTITTHVQKVIIPPIIVITVPKSGSHLLTKVINLMTDKEAVWMPIPEQGFNFKTYELTKKQYLWGHPWPTNDLMKQFNRKAIKIICIIRDPRDVLISSIFYAQKTHPEIAEGKTFDDLFMYYLENPVHENHPNLFLTSQFGPLSFAQRYEIFLHWGTLPNVLFVRFEDLVGSKGGGNDDLQRKTIYRIAEHLNMRLSKKKVRSIQKKLFGGTVTFREGKIGSWRKYFDEEKVRLIKQHFSHLLINLGYEKDANWSL